MEIFNDVFFNTLLRTLNQVFEIVLDFLETSISLYLL